MPTHKPLGTKVKYRSAFLTGPAPLYYDELVQDVADGRKVILVPDWPGTGRSTGIQPDQLTGDVVCRAIGDLIEDQDDDVVLVVHSMSGPYGFRLLVTHGDHIAALGAPRIDAPGTGTCLGLP